MLKIIKNRYQSRLLMQKDIAVENFEYNETQNPTDRILEQMTAKWP